MSENCYHCGDSITGKAVKHDEHLFCCSGCSTVYQLLRENNLGSFYDYEKQAGVKPEVGAEHHFDFLDLPHIRDKYISFEQDHLAKTSLYLPSIHCSSCIYLLENIQRLNPHILSCQVQFAQKQATFTFDPQQLKLSELAVLLRQIGYQAQFGKTADRQPKTDRSFLYKLGIAGFAFGSIMLWTFPEYLGLEKQDTAFRTLTSYLSLIVSLPVLFYSANSYFISAYKGLKYHYLNLDIPIAIGILALYLQSVWSILNNQGSGYIDSFSGFVFLLLIGKWFQQKTYQALSFERDYSSYFPVAVCRLKDSKQEIVEIESLEPGDTMLIRNQEIIPCDAILLSDSANIDFSFVTGEADLISKKKGDFIYAGGKLYGQAIQLQVKNKSKRSHLTQLWNSESNEDSSSAHKQTTKAEGFKYQDQLSKYFLLTVLLLALTSGMIWYTIDPSQVSRIVVAVLIVTCPCALALSAPFTYGNTMRLLGRSGLYLKNTGVIELLNEVDHIVFDKTGTLTTLKQEIRFIGPKKLSQLEAEALILACSGSIHPLSQRIQTYLESQFSTAEQLKIVQFNEVIGQGIDVSLVSHLGEKFNVKIGSAVFVGHDELHQDEVASFLTINGHYRGKFNFESHFRPGLEQMIQGLSSYELHVLTGDKQKDSPTLKRLFPNTNNLHFQQSPLDKCNYLKKLKQQGHRVLMIGDGLNDSGALNEAHVGIAISESFSRFSPSSSAILSSANLIDLHLLLSQSKKTKTILRICLSFSILYNLFGLYFAITGQLTPLVAAVLMPLSSITVVLISSLAVWGKAKKSTSSKNKTPLKS